MEGFEPATRSVFSTKSQVSSTQQAFLCFMVQTSLGYLHVFFSLHHARVTCTKQASTTDDYFLESANNISFFFEENAFQEDGKLRQDKALSINKIGHGTPISLNICHNRFTWPKQQGLAHVWNLESHC